MLALNLKALHIIFVVTWFAGIFYIVRLFVYHIEATEKPEPDRSILLNQYKLMSKRLWYIITWPSAILTLVLGAWLVIVNNWLTYPPAWLWWKYGFLVLLYIYHLFLHRLYKQLQRDEVNYTSHQMRVLNEVSTILLFAIVFVVELQNAINITYGIIGLIFLILLLYAGIKAYQKNRAKNE